MTNAPQRPGDLIARLRRMGDRDTRHDYAIGDYWNVVEEAADELAEARTTLAVMTGKEHCAKCGGFGFYQVNEDTVIREQECEICEGAYTLGDEDGFEEWWANRGVDAKSLARDAWDESKQQTLDAMSKDSANQEDRVMTPVQMILRYFKYDHLPENLQNVSRSFAVLAEKVGAGHTSGPETTAGLRKLLEAKDCIVRANLHERVAETTQDG